MKTLPSTLIVAAILVAVMLGASTSIISMFIQDESITLNDYDTQLLKDFQALNKTDDINLIIDNAEDAQDVLPTSTKDTNALSQFWGFLDSLGSAIWSILNLIFGGFGFIEFMIIKSSVILGVPSWIPGLIFGLITLVIAFTIFRIIFKVDT